jgi:hypothetical protein
LRRKRIELAIIAILIAGIIGYAGGSLLYSGARIASAERALNTVIAHQNTLNATFSDINTQLKALTGSSTFRPQDAVALVDRSVSNSELATTTISRDDASLRSELNGLDQYRWLTLVGTSNLDREAARIEHARNALAAARTIAADKALEGRFWHSLYSGLVDLATLKSQTTSGDLTSAQATLKTMKRDIDQAAQQSGAPPLPTELAGLTRDLQAFVDDYGKQLDAQVAGDDASVAAYQANVQSDLTKIASYDIDAIGKAIDAFYQPLIERFNSEMGAATA